MARNNWRLVRNNKINTKDEEVWMYHNESGEVALGPPSLVQEGGFSHWKRVMAWEPDPGLPDEVRKPKDVGTTIPEIAARVREVEEDLGIYEDSISEADLDAMIEAAERAAFDAEEDDDDELPW